MSSTLSSLQRKVIERLNILSMEDFAARASEAWCVGRPYPCKLTPAERATMEGAALCADYKLANQEAKAIAQRNAG